MDKLITEWKKRAKELDAEVMKYNGRGASTTMGNETAARAYQIRECIKDLQKKINHEQSSR